MGRGTRSSGGRAAMRRTWRRPAIEALEGRALMAAGTGPGSGGVDALALGDVNADQIVDVIVAGRQAGNYVVTIYDGRGTPAAHDPNGATVNVLWTVTNPLGAGVGPLRLAAGDFDGDGASELALSSGRAMPAACR